MKEPVHILIWTLAVGAMLFFAIYQKMMTTWYQELIWGIVGCIVIVLGSFTSSGAYKQVKVKK